MAVVLVVLGAASVAGAELSRQELTSLFVQGNDAFRQANVVVDDSERAGKLYERAILSYEKVINEGGIRNARLFYNLGNAYFLKNDLGRAILNYRRAEELAGVDRDIAKNLAFARSRRVDEVGVTAERRVLQTLFFWHYDFSLSSRFLLGCVFFACLCVGLSVIVWVGRNASAITVVVIAGLLTVCFSGSVVVETVRDVNTRAGVVTASEVVAHQGDWENSPASFKDPLHAGLEFELIEERRGWYHIRLPDGSDGWVGQDSAELI